ncbi:MAG TPA: hypothetical protein DCQ52_10735 [Acidimicrobiaceae bacterium]|jgi:uncharacterized protein (DUF983 family)|nr:hypothetical protein [Acidimicrobiaceae bacterium]
MGGMNRPLPSAVKMFRRALVLKCPLCGSRRTFIRRWMLRYDRCRTCGIRWHREHGFELGPIALNIVITFFTLGVSMVIAFVATAPDFPVLALTIGFVVGAIVVPLVAFPFTNTLWMAFDLLSNKPDEAELAEAAAAVAVAA